MKKLINSISFYIIALGGMVMVLNNNFNLFNIVGVLIIVLIWMWFKDSSKEEIYDTLGITWLQKRFKNNDIIMDMTNE